jgi:hypothetical protein
LKAGDSTPSKGIETLARSGYFAKGVVYTTVALLTAAAPLQIGLQTRATGATGAIKEIARQPFGQLLLFLLALGLIGYVVWCFTQALVDPERKGRGLKGIVGRAGALLAGAVYTGLAAFAIRLLVTAQSASGSGSGSPQSATAIVMAHTGGIVLVAAIGVGFLGIAMYHVWLAYSRSFERVWDVAAMGILERRVATRVARIGLVARAIVFVLIGSFLITAAIETDPSEARGLGGALNALAAQPYGRWLLALVGAGLLCYGGFCFVNARYRHIDL